MAKLSRSHPVFDLARTRNRNATWDGLMCMLQSSTTASATYIVAYIYSYVAIN